ncbi:MAG: terminase small subunit [Burkholderiaceae bacterium]
MFTPKQAAFIAEYLVDRNATQAAIRAGYSPRTAASIGEENLRKPEIRAAIDDHLRRLAEETMTEAQWVRLRLREEATEFGPDASHSARVRALELLGKINGIFEIENRQKSQAAAEFLASLQGNVIGPVWDPGAADDDD